MGWRGDNKPLNSMRNLLSSSSAVSASMSSKISVISSSAVVNRKLGKPREGEELLEDGDEVRRRSSGRKDDLENCLSASSLFGRNRKTTSATMHFWELCSLKWNNEKIEAKNCYLSDWSTNALIFCPWFYLSFYNCCKETSGKIKSWHVTQGHLHLLKVLI